VSIRRRGLFHSLIYTSKTAIISGRRTGGVTLPDDKFTYDIENRRIGKNTLSGGQSWTAYR
jgi:hypothetical protein